MQNLGGLWILFFPVTKGQLEILLWRTVYRQKYISEHAINWLGGLENLIQQQIICFINSRMQLTALNKSHYIYFN